MEEITEAVIQWQKDVKSVSRRSQGYDYGWPINCATAIAVIKVLKSMIWGDGRKPRAYRCQPPLAVGFSILDTWISERKAGLGEFKEQQQKQVVEVAGLRGKIKNVKCIFLGQVFGRGCGSHMIRTVYVRLMLILLRLFSQFHMVYIMQFSVSVPE